VAIFITNYSLVTDTCRQVHYVQMLVYIKYVMVALRLSIVFKEKTTAKKSFMAEQSNRLLQQTMSNNVKPNITLVLLL